MHLLNAEAMRSEDLFATRYPAEYKLEKFKQLISFGGSPRASINLAMASKAYAFIKRRGYEIGRSIRNPLSRRIQTRKIQATDQFRRISPGKHKPGYGIQSLCIY